MGEIVVVRFFFCRVHMNNNFRRKPACAGPLLFSVEKTYENLARLCS